jgi:hypothetical protein
MRAIISTSPPSRHSHPDCGEWSNRYRNAAVYFTNLSA